MVAYTKPQQSKKEESEMLRGQRDQIKFIDLRFERWQAVRFRKARRTKSKVWVLKGLDFHRVLHLNLRLMLT